MKNYWRLILTIAIKDILLEVRSREIILPVLVFAFLVGIVFNFAIDPTPETVATVVPGMLWVAFTFGGILGLNRSFSIEKDNGCIEGLMICPVSRDVIFLGKMLSNYLFMLAVEAVVFPVFAAMFNVSFLEPEILVLALVTTIGFASVGTLFSAMAVNTRSRELMLPLLFLPVVVPILVAAVEGTAGAVKNDNWGAVLHWIQLITAFDVIFVVVSAFAFSLVLEE